MRGLSLSLKACRTFILSLSYLVGFAAACDRHTAEVPLDSAVATAELVKLKTSEAEKDSLIQDLLATSRFVNEINSELSKVRRLRADRPVKVRKEDGTLVSAAAYRAGILERIRELTSMLEASEQRLQLSRSRAESATQQDTRLLEQIAEYQRTLTEYREIVEDQKQEIAKLNTQVVALRVDRSRLVGENTTLADSVATLAEIDNTVFWIAGSKADLLQRNVIVEEGGARGLLLVRRGKTLMPSRNVDEQMFTAINRVQTSEIPLPRVDVWYRIVSRQSLEFIDGASKGRVKGALRIHSPEKFWAASRHLILVEDN
ncbi:MAG: hypothetical protein ABMA00_18820 [Gemmatimonas sp.]